MELSLVTGYDKKGRQVKTLSNLLPFLRSTKFTREDRLRLLYIMKIKQVPFSNAEKEMIESYGFRRKDIDLEIDTRRMIRPDRPDGYKYTMSRYEPIVSGLVKSYIKGEDQSHYFQDIGRRREEKGGSLRKSTMISSKRQNNRRTVIVYMKGGLTIEECRLAYELSDSLGINVLFGGDKILTPEIFIDDLICSKDTEDSDVP
jgi:syntaxin-binding protein 1